MTDTVKYLLAFFMSVVIGLMILFIAVYSVASIENKDGYKIKTQIETQQQLDHIEHQLDHIQHTLEIHK